MNTVDPHLLTGAYAVDALDEGERAAFEAHLAECADCRAEVAELQAAAAGLAALSATPPPESLRENVLAAISSTRQLPPVSSETEGADTEPERDPHRLPAIGRPGSRWARRLAMPVAAALLGVLALSLGAWGLNQRDRADQVATRADLVAAVLTAPDATSTSAQFGSGRASLVVSADRGAAVMVATGLAHPGEGKVYEMWRLDAAGNAVPAGTSVPSANGVLAAEVEGSIADTKTVAVTIEPEGGSEKPTGAPIGAFPVA